MKRKKKFIPEYGGGIPVGYNEKKDEYLYERLDYHSGVDGATGIGKTTRIFIPAVYIMGQHKENMIISDNKREIYSTTKKYLEKQGYDVRIVDYRNPEYGDRVNLLQEVINHVDEGDLDSAQMEAIDLAASLIPRSENETPMWGDGSESAIASVILAICLRKDFPITTKSISNVFNNIIQLGKSEQDGSILDRYFNSPKRTQIEKIAFGNYGMSSSKVRMSFNTMATSSIREYSYEKVKKQTSYSDFNLRDYTKNDSKPFALFIVSPDEKDSMNRMAPGLVEYCYRVLVDESNRCDKSKLPTRWHFLLDEFTNNGKFKNFVQRLTLSRGRNIFYHLGYQGTPQIQSLYGEKDTQSILDNLGIRIWTEFADQTEIKDYQEKTGHLAVVSSTQTENSRGLFDISLNKNSYQYNSSRVPIFKNEYLTTLGIPDAVAKRRSMYAFKTILPVWMDTGLVNVFEKTNNNEIYPRIEDDITEYWKLLPDPMANLYKPQPDIDLEPINFYDNESENDVDLPDNENY